MYSKSDLKKVKRVKYSSRREKLAQLLVMDPKKSMKQAMIEAGYSKSSATNGGAGIVKSKGFQQAMEKFLPDQLLLEKHREFLNSKRLVKEFRKGDVTTEISETDPSAVRALDLAYKIKGRYITPGVTQNNLVIQVSDKSAARFGMNPAPDAIHAEIREMPMQEAVIEAEEPEDEPHPSNPLRTKKGHFKKGVNQRHVYNIDTSAGSDSD